MAIKALVFLLLFLSACVKPLSTPATPSLQSPRSAFSPDSEAEEEVQTSPSLGTSYTTIAEVFKHPALFDSRRVRLQGKVVNVQSFTSQTGRPSTTFALVDSTGNAVKVVTKEHTPAVRTGLEVAVEGRLTLLRSATSPSALVKVEAARIEPISSPRKAPARSATRVQPEQLPPSRPLTPSQPPPTLVEDEGKIF